MGMLKERERKKGRKLQKVFTEKDKFCGASMLWYKHNKILSSFPS